MADQSVGMAGIIIGGCDHKLFAKHLLPVKLILLILLLFNLWNLRAAWLGAQDPAIPFSTPLTEPTIPETVPGEQVEMKPYLLTEEERKLILERSMFKLQAELSSPEVLAEQPAEPEWELTGPEEIIEAEPPFQEKIVALLPEIRPLENPFILLAVSQYPEDERAIILNIFNNQSQIVGTGDVIDGFTVETIHKEQLVLSRDGQQIKVTFEQSGGI